MAEKIEHIYQFKRGTAQRWKDVNPILKQGEPGFEFDTGKLKIGDGFTPWLALKYINYAPTGKEEGFITVTTYEELPSEGNENLIYRVKEESLLYQWNNEIKNYEILGSAEEIDIDAIREEISTIAVTKPYEINHTPQGTIIDYSDNEIRVMCPADALFSKQTIGPGGEDNKYYMSFKAYAPKDAMSFKESEKDEITENASTFDGENAGIDTNGRKYSIVWLPIAIYDEITDSWSYYGKGSTIKKYIGWTYNIEWYDAAGVKIAADKIRINLSNENCHNFAEPYYMGSIDLNRLIQAKGDTIILYGGSATENV